MRLALIEVPDDFDFDKLGDDAVLRGLYQKPTKYCRCESPSSKSVPGSKFGWWVCGKCRKAKPLVGQSPKNLLFPFRWPPDGKTRYRVEILHLDGKLVDGEPLEHEDGREVLRRQAEERNS
jgi:hypothetical protein